MEIETAILSWTAPDAFPDATYNVYISDALIDIDDGATVALDTVSPISDTTILSSVATGTDLMDHVLTQLPLASLAAGISALLYTMIALIAL